MVKNKYSKITRALQATMLVAAVAISGQALALNLDGKVVDRDSNEPVEGAEVFLINTETQALVQSKFVKKNGTYKFEVPKAGEYDVMVRRHQYNSVRKRAVLVQNDKTLAPISMELSGWEVENVKEASGDQEGCD